MIRSRHQIELKEGVMVEMLFTPSMYERGRERGIKVTIEDSTNAMQVTEAYVKRMYLGAVNAWEALRFDNPGMGDFPYSYIDFMEWSGDHPKEFQDLVSEIFKCITGKTVEDAIKESVESGNGVKKK